MYVRLFSYARYLNQRSLDGSFVNFFGNTQSIQQRQDIQLNKFFLPFSGWFLTPSSGITSTSGRPIRRRAIRLRWSAPEI